MGVREGGVEGCGGRRERGSQMEGLWSGKAVEGG